MDEAELALFRQTVARTPLSDQALVDLGWADALGEDDQAAVSVLFSVLGATNSVCSALGVVMGAAGGLQGGIVLPAIGGWAVPGRLVSGGIEVEGLCRGGAGPLVTAVPDGRVHRLERSALESRPVEGLDPTMGLVQVSGRIDHPGGPEPFDWDAAVAAGRRALAHEMVGGARRMLELARQHALDRVQGGRPIAGYQAVRHRLAETLVAIEAADALAQEAWADRSPGGAARAKASAGRAARVAAKHCQQVLGGIGFTTEHPLHRYVRRVLVLDQLLGGAAGLSRAIGEEAVASGRLPAPTPL
jgi:hypothetical protein